MFFVNTKRSSYTLSLAARLVFGTFIASLFTSLLLTFLLANWTTHRLRQEYSVNLKNHLAEMEEILTEIHGDLRFKDKSSFDRWIEAELRNWPYYTRLIDSNGVLVAQTDGMPISSAEFLKHLSMEPEHEYWRQPDGREYMLVRKSAYKGDHFVGQVQVARDLSDEQRRSRKMTDMFIWISFIASALIGFFTWLISQYMLRPIEQMQQEIRHIGVSDLGYRLQAARWPQELRPLAGAFDKMIDGLEDNFNRLSQFSSDLAHELRTPIHNLTVELDVTLTQPRSNAEYQNALESAQERVAHLSRLVSDLLFIARAENRTDALSLEKLDLKQQVQIVQDFFQAVLEERQVTLSNQADGYITADAMKLRRALVNLVSNALGHTPSGGSIVISSEQNADGVSIGVLDTGCGITPEVLPHLFDRFFKANLARKSQTSTEGSGLGLPIVRSIMTLHNGSVQAAIRPEGGAAFMLFFPTAEPKK